MRKNKISLDTLSYAFVLTIGLLVCLYILPKYKQPTFVFYAGTLLLSVLAIRVSEIVLSSNSSRILFGLGIFIFGIPHAFHNPTMSIDDYDYMQVFEWAGRYSIGEITQYFKESGQEKGYLLLNWIVNKLTGGDYYIFQVIRTYFTFFLWGYAIRKFTKETGGGALMILFIWSHIYFFVLNSGLIRIFMSIPMVLVSIYYILHEDIKKYFVSILLASVLHMSALIMLLLLPYLIFKNYFYKHWILFFVSSFFVVVASLLTMATYLIPLLGDRYEGYGEVNDLSVPAGAFTTLPIFIAIYYFYKNMSFESVLSKKRFIIGMLLVALSIVFSIVVSVVQVGRIIFYTYLGLMIVFPLIFQNTEKKFIGLVLKYLIIIYPLVYVMSTNMLNASKTQLFPFYSFIRFN